MNVQHEIQQRQKNDLVYSLLKQLQEKDVDAWFDLYQQHLDQSGFGFEYTDDETDDLIAELQRLLI